MKQLILSAILLFSFTSAKCQEQTSSEIQQISETIMLYIDGTANGEPDKLRKAFHPDFNLYSVLQEDSVRIWKGKEYIDQIKKGEKNDRIGRIISIDYENDAAIAKAEINIPNWRIFTDYFLLLKYDGSWKIMHKSYTWREYPKSQK